jgi:hypothetical protein
MQMPLFNTNMSGRRDDHLCFPVVGILEKNGSHSETAQVIHRKAIGFKGDGRVGIVVLHKTQAVTPTLGQIILDSVVTRPTPAGQHLFPRVIFQIVIAVHEDQVIASLCPQILIEAYGAIAVPIDCRLFRKLKFGIDFPGGGLQPVIRHPGRKGRNGQSRENSQNEDYHKDLSERKSPHSFASEGWTVAPQIDSPDPGKGAGDVFNFRHVRGSLSA